MVLKNPHFRLYNLHSAGPAGVFLIYFPSKVEDFGEGYTVFEISAFIDGQVFPGRLTR